MDTAFMRKSFALIAKGLAEKEELLSKEPTRYPYSKTLQHGINMFLSACYHIGRVENTFQYANETAFLEHYITKPIYEWFSDWDQAAIEKMKLQEESFYAYDAFAYRRSNHMYIPSADCFEFLDTQDEVPDYYTMISEKSTDEQCQYASVSGVFQYSSVFWGILERPNDTQYTSSFKKSRIDYPKQRFAEKDMIELYPMQLQPGDHPNDWIFYTNVLRHVPIQYNQSTVLPLPLHLAKCLEEYLFDA